MARTCQGYHTIRRIKNTDVASFREPSPTRCSMCNKKFVAHERKSSELRPTGAKFGMQQYFYCLKCQRIMNQ
jgi:uncharacterized protein with PIN domain